MRKKRIAIAARGLNQPFSGPQVYIDGFTKAFTKLARNYDVHLYYNTPKFLGRYPNAYEHVLPLTNKLTWDHIILPRALKSDQIDIAIFPKGTIPLICSAKSIAIMLDLGYFYPKLNAYKPLDTLYMKMGMRFAAKHASGVFSISEYTAKDVINILHAVPQKVHNIYAGVDKYRPVRDQSVLEAVKNKYQLQTPFIFYPTSISPRKNIDRTLDAFEKIQDQIPHHLYFTGKLSWNSRHTQKRLDGKISQRVHLLGSVPPEDMPALYSLSAFTIYPSLFEGFGLPVVESFLCESAVLTSNETSLPEVAGGAALVVSAYSIDDIAHGIYRLATDDILRQGLIEKGKKQAKKFTWENTAQAALDWIDANL